MIADLLRNARLEELRNARQTAGDVAGFGSLASDTRDDVAGLDRGVVVDREHRARRQHVAGGFARCSDPVRVIARTKVFLGLGAARRAVFRHDALGDAGGFVGDFRHRRCPRSGPTYFTVPPVSVMTGMVNGIPFGHAIALGHDVTVVEHHICAVGDTIDRKLAAVHVLDRDLARAAEHDATAALIHRSGGDRGTRPCRRHAPPGCWSRSAGLRRRCGRSASSAGCPARRSTAPR